MVLHRRRSIAAIVSIAAMGSIAVGGSIAVIAIDLAVVTARPRNCISELADEVLEPEGAKSLRY